MRKLGLILFLAALAALFVAGCGEDDSKPVITRLYASETCGVAPLRVDFRADVSGGKPLADPTGGNAWLRIVWDFGDGHGIDNGTSIAYHEFADTGTFNVTVTAEDDNGERASRSIAITVIADSLGIQAFSRIDGEPGDEIAACRPIEFYTVGNLCGFDPDVDSYERFIFRWEIGDSVYTGTNPFHAFAPVDVGDQDIHVVIEDPIRSITRRDTVFVNVLASPGADLSLEADWLGSPQPTAEDTLRRDVPGFPETMPYTVTVSNAGPADAYNVGVRGSFPSDPQLYFIDQVQTDGSFYYDASAAANRYWLWVLPVLPAGSSETVDVTFGLDLGDERDDYLFATAIEPYACDTIPANNQAAPVLHIESAPSDLSVSTDWLSNEVDPTSGPDLVHVVAAFPDTLTYSVDIRNDGPSAAWDLVLSGEIPTSSQLHFLSANTFGIGVFAFDPDTSSWTWTLTRVGRGIVTIDLNLRLTTANPGQLYEFPTTLSVEPDDPTPDDHDALASLFILAVP